ncbi:hypothetical protein ACFV0D_33715 [Streptomyces sp. NPDC059556]|uniref:hypothetical protein n=1 Tax=Streptomyces sp. NPDC059556 TaxID=3346863 RepID=UPI0036B21A5C
MAVVLQTTDFAAAGEALRNMALAQCEGTLSVIKQIVPEDAEGEDVTGAEPAGEGWQFDASTTTAGIGGLPDTETTVSDGTGGVAFKPTFPAGTTDADVTVTVTEAQQPGYELVTQGAKNAVCTNLDDGEPVDVTNTGTASAPAFTVDVPRLAAVSCIVHNRPVPTEPTPTPTEPTPTEPTPTPTDPTPTPTPTDPTPTPTSSEPTPGPTHLTYPPNPPGGYGDELAEAGSARAQSLGLVALFLATSGSSLAAWKLRRRGRSALQVY